MNPQPRQDDDLVKQAAGGDRVAFAALLEAHYSMIYRVAYKWCGSRTEAEDVAQDVCIRLGEVIGSFRFESAFSSWLYRITLNVVRDHQRKGRRQLYGQDELMENTEASDSPEETRAAEELWQKVATLPEKQRDAVLLVYAEGLSHAEAAIIMQCSEKTVSWHVHEARKQLKEVLS